MHATPLLKMLINVSEVTIANLYEICVQNDKLIFAFSANTYKTTTYDKKYCIIK